MLVFGFIPPRARVPDAHDENRTGCDNACRTCDQRDWRTKDIKAPNDAIRAFADLNADAPRPLFSGNLPGVFVSGECNSSLVETIGKPCAGQSQFEVCDA